MKKELEVMITGGGTISKIDDVRHIGNFSSGTTGALIAEEFLKNGAKVHYIHSKNAVMPFKRNLYLDPKKNLKEELGRLEKEYKEYKEYSSFLENWSFLTFGEYYGTVRGVLMSNSIDVVVLVAAVSDYSAVKKEGKISSDKENLKIELKKNPKVISLIKKWNPYVFQVGFKLLSGVSDEELIETAYRHGLKNKSDITVANILPRKLKKGSTYFVFPEKQSIPIKRSDLASKLVKHVNKRIENGKTNPGFFRA